MSNKPRILAFAGSLRAASFNKKLAAAAAEAIRAAGGDVTYVDLKDYPLPVYDGDVEDADGVPESAQKLKAIMKASDGFLITAPEYNSSITAVLKNVIDWASRPEEGEAPLACFRGKAVALMAASPGALGAMRGLVTVRSILGNIGMIVLPDQKAIPKAHEAFGTDGSITDEKTRKDVERIAATLVDIAGKLAVGS